MKLQMKPGKTHLILIKELFLIKILTYQKNFLNSVFAVGRSLAGGSTNLLMPAIKKKYNNSELKNLKVLSIWPRSEGEIFNIFAHGFELNNITGLDLFSYSPYIKLGDMHNLKFNDV